MEKILSISLELNFTQNTMGCCGLTQEEEYSPLNLKKVLSFVFAFRIKNKI